MNIERIMAFGCSITYGEGLIDAQEKSPELKIKLQNMKKIMKK